MSKRIWQHPAPPADETTVSWRGIGQLEDTPEFREWLEREFPQGAAELEGEADVETSRRSFLKLMGASTALAGFGMAACRRPEAYILPFAQAPEWTIPGKALYYATSMPRAGGATPLVVTTFEGRPTSVAPNRKHPDQAGTDAFAQASVLDLYSPSRSRTFLKQGKSCARVEFEAALKELAKNPGKTGFVFGEDQSPTRDRLRGELAKKFPGAKFYTYEPLAGGAQRAILDKVKGEGSVAVADFSKADRILALDCDFVALDPQGPVGPFFDRRKPEGKDYQGKPDAAGMNRLYAVEGAYTLTGGMADHRLRVASSQVIRVAAAIARQLASQTGGALSDLVAEVPVLTDEKQLAWVRGCVADLLASKGRVLVLAGSRQSEGLHHLALAINAALGSIGDDKPLRIVKTGRSGTGGMAELAADLKSGAIETLFLLTPANPVYDAPADWNFAELLGKAKTSVHLGLRADATARAATWHVPAAHYLEAWGDSCSATGVHTVVQPMILPLYDTCVSENELLLALLHAETKLVTGEGEKGGSAPAYDAVRATFFAGAAADEVAWKKFLRDGFRAGTRFAATEPAKSDPAAAVAAIKAALVDAPAAGKYEVVFATDASLYDGRWIDNGWLQEAPDPVSKLTWDNAALVAPKTAKEMGVYDQIVELENSRAAKGPDNEGGKRRNPMIKVTVNGQDLELPVMISFGQAENTIVVALGYGQGFDEEDELGRGPKNADHVGLVGVNRGFNAYPLRTAASQYLATGASVSVTGRDYSIAVTQEHHSMYGRAIAREISTATDHHDGDFQHQLANVRKQWMDAHTPPNISLYKPLDDKGQPLTNDDLHQWGMAIDLSSCMGCNSCLVACQSENNIPIVGKRQLAIGREMHWIRMDRYFAAQKDNDFDADNPAFVPQPVACVHCESAPCETVCPVNATVHTEDGLNAMAYNRCIGTRYCANNCPYKARRFNYFDYNKRNPLIAHNLYKGPFGKKKVGEAPHLQRNPNVSVRMRGVMEKCTYCVQRLKEAKIRQKRGQAQETLAAGVASTEVKVGIDTLRVPVDAVRVACQDACPADAISFGNLLDDKTKDGKADARVVLTRRLDRSYDLLQYIGTRPRTAYLARVKNPNPEMPDAKYVGKATIHMI